MTRSSYVKLGKNVDSFLFVLLQRKNVTQNKSFRFCFNLVANKKKTILALENVETKQQGKRYYH